MAIDNSIIGIAIGLFAAALQSGSYVFSGKFVRETGRGMLSLLLPAFTLMAVFSLAALPFFAVTDMPPLRSYAGAAMMCMFCCLVGQAGMFFMYKTVDASRVSPLLAVKVPMLALFYCVVFGEKYTPVQWLGVTLVVPAAWLLCKAGRAIPARALLWLVFGCVFFAASDHCIKLVLAEFKECGSTLRSSLLGFFAVYAAGGIYGVAGMVGGIRPTRREFTRHILPFSLFWYFGIAVLFVCFAMIGIVHGNIVQSTRGLISVALGWFIARAGFERLEEKVPPRIFAKRVFSAVLIIVAVLLFKI
ncbi:MAG: DMT family transporter [Kiritimatiellaeota bacterium]|nr:DMT family transporter [Kiritimatiellota bacterium]